VETFKEKKKKQVACSVQPIGFYQNDMHLITVRVELKAICTVDINVHAELPRWCHLKWQGKCSILFEPCHHLRTYCSFLFLLQIGDQHADMLPIK